MTMMRLIIISVMFSLTVNAQNTSAEQEKMLQEMVQNQQPNQGANEQEDQGDLQKKKTPEQPRGTINSKVLAEQMKKRVKTPFSLPTDLFILLKKKLSAVEGEGIVDESVDPKRRWALRHYKLIAAIWDVQQPKAIIIDKNDEGNIYYIGERVGNNEGVITAISNGEVTVIEKGVKHVLKIVAAPEAAKSF